ncbi:putative late blight resistance protein homolog R1B-17 [Andrographis paniculata]|uniref:putative late blight resistance protein homolog R1B-17 n=1 Tax=Andrographis paniculata TaxID=175694 RepID=UPI0021E87206|nr:putative late blight resistance protein homolog R1B-17 [Andrographis paniculata]
MAYYAALASLVNLLEDIILHDQYPNFLLGKQPIIKSLLEKFSLLEASLQDYSSKGDEAGDCVEARIKDVAYRAQDVIESEISNQIDFKPNAMVKILLYPLISGCQIVLQRLRAKKCEEELREVERQVDSIVEEVKKAVIEGRRQTSEDFQLSRYSTSSGVAILPADPTPGNEVIEGFNKYLTTLKDQLCRHSSQLQVIPIVGMGGIGKTTLARAAFDDQLSVYHFDHRAWVAVSQDYCVCGVLCSILKSMHVNYDELCEKDEGLLKERIYKHLIGHRYLVVIDDVWSPKLWDDIKHAFPETSIGSRILLTTRLLDVAYYVCSSDFLHEMQLLDVNASWILLRRKVFGGKRCPQNLKKIGKLIASKCQGLPLAIVIIAGVLVDVQTPQHWEEVSRNVGSFLSKSGDEQFSNILSLSYNNLSHLLKACLLYIGSFPEDYGINVRKLTWLWIAEGFLKSTQRFQTLEQVAEECLEDLVRRNLIIITMKGANGKFKRCMMHDLLRDFCRQRAVHEGFFHGLDMEEFLSSQVNKSKGLLPHSKPGEVYGSRRLIRTILWFGRSNIENARALECHNFRLLKTVDLSNAKFCCDLRVFSRMFHLKYIALKPERHELLGSHIFKLKNLQTMVIYQPTTPTFLYFKIPSDIWQMVRLRHLIIPIRTTLPAFPMDGDPPLRMLENLQTLKTLQNFIFTKKAVEMIPNLRTLEIHIYGGSDGIWENYCLHNLIHLRRLEKLNMAFTIPSCISIGDSFIFPHNLKKLSLSGCRLHWIDMKAVGSLPNLQVLRLRKGSFVGEEWEPIEGQFLQLKFLLMEFLEIKQWRAESTHFPRLQRLIINWCRYLEKIPMELGEILPLEFIYAYGSRRSLGDSVKLILEEQRSLGNDVLRVLVRGCFY